MFSHLGQSFQVVLGHEFLQVLYPQRHLTKKRNQSTAFAHVFAPLRNGVTVKGRQQQMRFVSCGGVTTQELKCHQFNGSMFMQRRRQHLSRVCGAISMFVLQ